MHEGHRQRLYEKLKNGDNLFEHEILEMLLFNAYPRKNTNPIAHELLNRFPSISEVLLGPTEFKLLHFFMTHPERVYSREQLLNHVWGTNVYVEDRTVDVHIRRLRKALEHSGHDRMVQTVRGTGYRFSARF